MSKWSDRDHIFFGGGVLEKNLDITWRIIMPFGVDQM